MAVEIIYTLVHSSLYSLYSLSSLYCIPVLPQDKDALYNDPLGKAEVAVKELTGRHNAGLWVCLKVCLAGRLPLTSPAQGLKSKGPWQCCPCL